MGINFITNNINWQCLKIFQKLASLISFYLRKLSILKGIFIVSNLCVLNVVTIKFRLIIIIAAAISKQSNVHKSISLVLMLNEKTD